ncbi:MAG TPA: acylphosphatase [Pusillimonas sp.]|uniref:acylphosphatase n=1 Tax=unclassified Pusillimonas TaxID=2640016 RepID=UPI0026392059|nr:MULTISPECIES: acylphosphatase [unclassified Pusillimonas]HLU20299.1 acylphosphatase [Pusillimonas sp.]
MKYLGPNHNTETLEVRVTGRVQGVGFRAATVRQAHSLGVTGWVRNAPDGSVEVLVQGEPEQVDHMLSWLHKGPPAAKVTGVTYTQSDTQRYFDNFQQI